MAQLHFYPTEQGVGFYLVLLCALHQLGAGQQWQEKAAAADRLAYLQSAARTQRFNTQGALRSQHGRTAMLQWIALAIIECDRPHIAAIQGLDQRIAEQLRLALEQCLGCRNLHVLNGQKSAFQQLLAQVMGSLPDKVATQCDGQQARGCQCHQQDARLKPNLAHCMYPLLCCRYHRPTEPKAQHSAPYRPGPSPLRE